MFEVGFVTLTQPQTILFHYNKFEGKLLPDVLEKLCRDSLLKIRQNPEHFFSPSLRVTLYKVFGLSNRASNIGDCIKQIESSSYDFTLADSALGWLAILTAERILPIWRQLRLYQADADYEMLWGNAEETISVAKEVLLNTRTALEAYNFMLGLYYNPSASYNDEKNVLRFYFTTRVASDALEFLLMGVDAMVQMGTLFYSDAEIHCEQHDFATMAITAYANFEKSNKAEKRLEFWEWWLTEAIPQAWELAQKTYKPK